MRACAVLRVHAYVRMCVHGCTWMCVFGHVWLVGACMRAKYSHFIFLYQHWSILLQQLSCVWQSEGTYNVIKIQSTHSQVILTSGKQMCILILQLHNRMNVSSTPNRPVSPLYGLHLFLDPQHNIHIHQPTNKHTNLQRWKLINVVPCKHNLPGRPNYLSLECLHIVHVTGLAKQHKITPSGPPPRMDLPDLSLFWRARGLGFTNETSMTAISYSWLQRFVQQPFW